MLHTELRCDMVDDCREAVTHIDSKGYVYCAKHGHERKAYQRCRKLTPKEHAQLTAGEPLARY
jgi:hypothetical protein